MTYAPEPAKRRRWLGSSRPRAGEQAAGYPTPYSPAPLVLRLILTVVLLGWVGSTGVTSPPPSPASAAESELRRHAGEASMTAGRLRILGAGSESGLLEGRRPEPVEGQLSELPIGMMVHPPALDYFNAIARADDIGAVLVVSTGLLPRITGGQRLVMSPSVQLAEERADEFVGNTEYFGYNIEHWPDTPTAEQSGPAAASAAAAEFARQHGLRYVIGPDLQFTEDFGPELAAPAEIYVIQGQRIQDDIPFFTTTVTDFAASVRRANPSLRVWVQVSASFGTPQRTLEALQAVAGHIDGIWIHYNQNAQSFAALQELVALLRGVPRVPTPPAPFTQPEPTRAASITPTPSATPVRPTQQPTRQRTNAPTPSVTPILPATAALPTPQVVPEPPASESPAAPWLPIAGAAIVVLAAGLIAIGFVAGSMWQRRS